MYVARSCLLLLLASIHKAYCSLWPTFIVDLTHNGPIVSGNSISFQATVRSKDDPKPPQEDFIYKWQDNALPQHSGEVQSTSNVLEWNVTYPAHKYYPGVYEMEVNVERKFGIIYVRIGSHRVLFNITSLLNGNLSLKQHKQEIANDKYVALNQELSHEVVLDLADAEFLKKATDIETYIFIDCQYVNKTKGLIYKHNYTKLNAELLIEALVVVSFDPPVIVPTTPLPPSNVTTTSTPVPANGTSPTPATDGSNATSTKAPSTTSLPTTTVAPSTTLAPTGYPYVCNNSSQVSPDLNKTYGYFSRNIKVEAALVNIKANGNLWLQHGDMLGLDIKCNGSAPFHFCYDYVVGGYNVTGNETCAYSYTNEKECAFRIDHYFREAQEYTLIVILTNNVGRVITPIGVNIYQVTKHAQLSVIWVPISFLSLAVITIVFGLAYYVQSRNRFVIETADFDFSNTSTDMEYKTFRERLREALAAALNNSDFVEPDSVWSPPGQSSGRRYGSMQ